MAFDQQKRNLNENLKFVEDSNGDIAIRVKVDSIAVSEGSSFKWKDHRGFVIMELFNDGRLFVKGKLVKV